MGYKVKWVEDHLGISRKALRNYERLGLMPPNKGGKYRDYSDEDIDRIWSIKLLQGVGYSLAEIRELMDNPEADFYKSISEKVVELERKRDDITNFIEFAKTIKLTGRVPTTKEVGSIRYTLWDEGGTIYCSRCTHRTRTSDGEEDLVECPHCHEMRDSKAYYCRHCNMPF